MRINIYAIHHDAAVFPEPEKFKPERWINNEADIKNLLAFGHGLRTCIGNKFSIAEQKIFLIRLLQKYALEPVDPQIEYATGPVLKPTGNNYIKLVPRK